MEKHAPELITIEEFAKRIGVSRTTAFEWKKRGALKAGRHYFQIGRTIRFEWGERLLNILHEDSLKDDEAKVTEMVPQEKPRTISCRKPSINLNY